MMKNIKWMALAAALTAGSMQAQAAPERIGDFSLIDESGMAHQVSKYAYQNAVVFISQSNSCSTTQRQFTEYKILSTKYDQDGVSFVYMNSSPDDTYESIAQYADTFRLDLPILIDDTQLAAETLGITKVGEIVIVNPKNQTILYRGPMDTPGTFTTPGTTHMKQVLEAVRAGEIASLTETKVVEFDAPEDCALEFPTRTAGVPDYETEVAPILIERCVVCHVEGGIGPFAMNSHQMVQGWSPMIREVLLTKRMPPSQVDPAIKHFENARNMPIEEVQTLVRWIDAGSPRE